MSTKRERREQRRQQNRMWMLQLAQPLEARFDPNPRHSLYYQRQLSLVQADWDRFLDTMRRDLPSSFRISSINNHFLSVLLANAVQTDYKRPRGTFIATNGQVNTGDIVCPVAWCPNSYTLTVDNATLMKEKGLARLARFVLREVSLGHIVRQELVSMIPACLLEVCRGQRVLDLCASPGSKTEQLLGMMSKGDVGKEVEGEVCIHVIK
jgi:multisite-specific tRNA:(cytosine-C5)-methyltransferase